MFGTNEITGQKPFKDAPVNSLYVTSIFYTIQGEGPLASRCAVFVRFAKCNLNCSFCDTFFDKGEWLTFDEIEQRAWQAVTEARGGISYEAPGQDSIPDEVILVITGGEPMLQPNIVGFLLSQAGKWSEIQIETNGLIDRTLPLGVVLVVSPKCTEPMLPAHGSLKRGHYLRPPPAVLMRADCLKFVVDANPLNAYHTPPDWAYAWMMEQRKPVYISPMNAYQEGKPLQLIKQREGQAATLRQRTENERISFWTPGLLDRTRNEANHQHAAKLCLTMGYRLSLQLHLYADLP